MKMQKVEMNSPLHQGFTPGCFTSAGFVSVARLSYGFTGDFNMLVRVLDADLERFTADRAALDIPYCGTLPKSTSGRVFAEDSELKAYNEGRFKLVGYAPGQEPSN